LTGRRAGYCSGAEAPGWTQPGPGHGFGAGRGLGRGRGGRFWNRGGHRWHDWLPGWWRGGHAVENPAPPTATTAELLALRDQAAALKTELDEVQRRLAAIETGSDRD